ncbi:MAG: hypothetical protein Q9160_002838 [Pyrenula sp. 1 TL-2023]
MEDPAFAVSDVSTPIQEILLAASTHAVTDLERLTKEYETALDDVGLDGQNVQDPDTGATPLHSAIASCEPEHGVSLKKEDAIDDAAEGEKSTIAGAEETIEWLLANGAQWNVLDYEGKTPGCRAWDLGQPGKTLYAKIVREAMIRELLIGKLERMQGISDAHGGDGYIELASEDEVEGVLYEEEPSQEDRNNTSNAAVKDQSKSLDVDTNATLNEAIDLRKELEEGQHWNEPAGSPNMTEDPTDSALDPLSNNKYLSTPLTSTENALVDAHRNGIMMSWETSIMHRSASALLHKADTRLLNVGFGMGIFDTFVQQHENRPLEHHIVEAHPDVLERLRAGGWYQKAGVTIHEGTWREVCSDLITSGKKFDVIFYDTFAEPYSAFRDFFSDAVPELLLQSGSSKWSFFNGMGADRQICFDVYQKVVDCELDEAGWTANFEDVEVPNEVIEDEKEWEGVRRKYWVVKTYRIPIVRYKGLPEMASAKPSNG